MNSDSTVTGLEAQWPSLIAHLSGLREMPKALFSPLPLFTQDMTADQQSSPHITGTDLHHAPAVLKNWPGRQLVLLHNQGNGIIRYCGIVQTVQLLQSLLSNDLSTTTTTTTGKQFYSASLISSCDEVISITGCGYIHLCIMYLHCINLCIMYAWFPGEKINLHYDN